MFLSDQEGFENGEMNKMHPNKWIIQCRRCESELRDVLFSLAQASTRTISNLSASGPIIFLSKEKKVETKFSSVKDM